MKFKKGLFITFEGPEASGKSSQIKLLSSFFKKNKIPYQITREPGGTKIAEKLRKIILSINETINPTEEILLLMAARLNHIENIIKPAIKEGKIVISDRFCDSTFVYQGYVNKYGINNSINLHKKILNNFLPIKTFLFLLPPSIINQRIKRREASNKYDKLNLNFHKKVIKGYKLLSKNNKRFHLLDAEKKPNILNLEIITSISNIK